jgi:F/Y-rich N-terminus
MPAEVKGGIHYHSEHNLFPIGYISIRTHASIFHKGQKAEYTCEILDGGDKPMFRVTSSEDPEHPIERVDLILSRTVAQVAGFIYAVK